MKPLTTREWLEQERLTMLPHADFAEEALTVLDEHDAGSNGQDDAKEELTAIAEMVGSCPPAATVVERVEWAIDQLDGLINIHGGEITTVVARVEEADLRWWAIWDVLVDAGVVGRNDKAAAVDVPGLLRMFLPAA